VSYGIKWTFYVIWPLKHGSSDGHGTNQRIVSQIDSEQVTIMDKTSSGLRIQTDQLHQKFMGFCFPNIIRDKDFGAASPFDNFYPNIPKRPTP
jgi:hypothetical protein